ncbi:autotransporter outer membrane beta-barrel domain-containing protein [Variovorax soli]|uniref:autotransporter outer membrane beta-barrel domain-containing protein n=1 Tax=Variovorax soli TaxID=376815 RepID=UPI000838BEE5|nr:autotransporter outer membrane beta-barrel domain-containing protein [Variovorax soli]
MKRIKGVARPRLNYVCAAFIAGTGALTSGAVLGQQVYANGTTEQIPANTAIDTGTAGGAGGTAVRAENNGQVTAEGLVTITTGGGAAHGVHVFGAGGTASFEQGVNITTTGVESYGLWSQSVNGLISVKDATINSNSTSAIAETGGRIAIENSDVTSTQKFGLHALGGNTPGDTTHIDAVDVSVTTSTARGVEATGYGSIDLSTRNRAANTVTTMGNNAAGIQAHAGGVVQSTGALTVNTSGMTSYGVEAYDRGEIKIDGQAGPVTVTTSGENSAGLVARQNGTVAVNGTTVSTTGQGAAGVDASTDGLVVLDINATITTQGDNAIGILARDDGKAHTDGSLTLSTSGQNATGVHATARGNVQLSAPESTDATAIATTGVGAQGVLVDNDASLFAAGSLAIDTAGENAHGLHANTGGQVAMTGGSASISITTTGASANGIWVQERSLIENEGDLVVSTAGDDSAGVLAQNGGQAVLTGKAGSSKVDTKGANALGLSAEGVGSSIMASDFAVTTAGAGSHGAAAKSGGSTTLANMQVSTAGDAAHGLHSEGAGAALTATSTQVSTTGRGAHAGSVANGGALSFTDGKLAASGADAAALYATGVDAVASQVDLTNTTLQSAQGPSIRVDGGTTNINLNNTPATENNGNWLHVTSAVAVANVALASSNAKGAALNDGGVSNVKLTDSRWDMTGNSSVTALDNIRSHIQFSAPAGGGYKTLTANNYRGEGGTIGLNTYLGADNSPTDRLVINGGAATGSTGLQLTNTGGPGALTTGNGIQVVQAANGGTTEAGAFALTSRALAGPYEYQLYRGATDASDAESWYLRSTREVPEPPVPPVPPVPVEPPVAGDPPAPPPAAPAVAPRYRPEVAAYLANQRENGNMFVHSLHDRLGEPQYTEPQRPAAKDQGRTSAWLRVVGRATSSQNQDGGFSADTDSVLLHGGGDVASWGVGGDAGRLHLGGMLGYGGSRTDARAAGNPNRAVGKAEGWNVGAYGTWYQNDQSKLGAYVDVWGNYGWYKNTVSGDSLPSVDYDATGWALSGETGYAFKPVQDSDWVVEPQAQLIYLKSDQDDVLEASGIRVHDGDNSGWISRLGVRTHATWVSPDGTRTQPYLTLNWWRDNTDSAVSFSNVAVSGLYPKDRYEIKMGVNADLAKGWTGWVNVGHQWGKQSFQSVTYRVGTKFTW